MDIAIASGKGGTGKTTVATSLARASCRVGHDVVYVDCDVEEPNGALFLRPAIERTQPVRVPVPAVDLDRCVGCGQCGEICQYSAILAMNGQVLTFPELCHGCGGCWSVCPSGAVRESFRTTGTVSLGRSGGVRFVQGELDIGQSMSPPVIRAVRQSAPAGEVRLFDAPPGTSCPVVETLREVDYVLLVTEPTPFGLNDLQLAVAMVRALDRPFGVVVNRADLDDGSTRDYLRKECIDLLAEIPDDRRVAEAYSRGELACDALPEMATLFDELHMEVLARGTAASGATA